MLELRTATGLPPAPSIRRNLVHDAADAHYTKMLVAVKYALARGRDAVRATDPKAAIKRAPVAVRAALLEVLPKTLLKCLVAGGDAGLKRLESKFIRAAEQDVRVLAPKLTMSFDGSNPLAVKWAKEHAAELAVDISDTTEQAIRDAVAEAVEGGDLSDLYDAVLDAVGDEDRAQLIARTEVMEAANEGQRQSWDQAVDEGLLSPDAKRVWIASDGACPECEELDGEETTLDGEYSDGSDGPPAHPNCRCTEGITG